MPERPTSTRTKALAGRVCWVTGASSGIGAATALALCERGATVVASARRAERLEALAARAPGPGRLVGLPLDVTDFDRHPELVAEAAARAGAEIEVVVHSAGISQRALAIDTSLEVDRRIMEVNYFAVVSLTKLLLGPMLARNSGHLVVISSVSGHVGSRGRSAYAASKHALHGFFDSVRAELADRGILVTLVCPGYVHTEIGQAALRGDGQAAGQTRDARAPEVRGISAERCAAAIVRGIERGQREVYVGGRELAGIYLKRAAPGLLARVVQRLPAPGV